MASGTMRGCRVHCWSLFSRMSSSSPEPLFSAAMQLSACQIPSLEVARMPLASSHLLHTLLFLALASPSHLVLSHLIPPGLMLAHGRDIFGHEEKGHSRDLPVQLRQAEDLESTYGPWSLVPQQWTDSEESWRGSWQRDSLLCLLQPPISSLLSCPFLPASPHSHSRFWSCVPPLLSHFNLLSLPWLWTIHPAQLSASSCSISYFHWELCPTGSCYPASPSSPSSSLWLFSPDQSSCSPCPAG